MTTLLFSLLLLSDIALFTLASLQHVPPQPMTRRSRCRVATMQEQNARLNRKQRRQHLQPPGTPPPPPAQPATALTPAVLAGIDEDHAYEQYFFDDATRKRLLALVSQFSRPLLLCTPSLAVAIEDAAAADGSPPPPYLLLDRDERFSFLSGYRPFNLDRPDADAARFDAADDAVESDAGGLDVAAPHSSADMVFCDPPFSNFPLASLRAVVDRLVGDEVPVFLAYNGRREEELRTAFEGRGQQADPVQKLGDEPLGYLSVKPKTANQIFLFGPAAYREGVERVA